MRVAAHSLIVPLIVAFCLSGTAPSGLAADTTITVFSNAMVHFTPDELAKYDTLEYTARDNGRETMRTLELPRLTSPTRILAHLTLKPIPKDERNVHDKWDRAGHVRLAVEDGPDIEMLKFMTAYGGRTEHTVDVTHLAPLLQGPQSIVAFIDTWVTPAWQIDFSLEYRSDSTVLMPTFARGVLFEQSYTAEAFGDDGIAFQVSVPADLQRVELYYLVSGHCTDGRGADEFVSKDNVISVDDVVVYRYRPWRDDCRQFRGINPYTARWSDGWWSSDYDRSGWCPGDEVTPLVLDLSDHLTEGDHDLRFRIENVRPKNDEDHFGYWRTSAVVVGYDSVD